MAKLSGFVSLTLLDTLNDYTHKLSFSLFLIAGCLGASALLVLVFTPAGVVNR